MQTLCAVLTYIAYFSQLITKLILHAGLMQNFFSLLLTSVVYLENSE